jgi:hypothetical protein
MEPIFRKGDWCKDDAKNLNAYLEVLSAKVYQAKLTLLETDRKITA